MALSRRWFLSLPAACFAQSATKGRVLPSAIKRYPDPATDFVIQRLTDPACSTILSGARSISRHGFLVCASDSSGRFEAYRIDLKTGQQRQLTDASDLEPHSLTLLPDDKGIVYLDGSSLMTANLASLRAHEIYRIPEGFARGRGLGLSEDGLYTALVEKKVDKKDSRYRLQLVNMAKASAETLAEGDEEMADPAARPKRASVLYRRAGAWWLANYDGKQNYRLHMADGGLGPAVWGPDGRSVYYLSYPAESARKLHALREFVPDSNEDKAVADTSQFVGLGRNADGSVFAGASGSKASPYVLLLVRTVRRELTLCEHRASDPAMVNPVFSPNSQRVFFGSDRHGKPAIYSLAVEKLVEETETA
jgi:oligogalacturonide lyase